MSRSAFRSLLLLVLALVVGPSLARAALRSPEEFLGRPVGQDRMLLGWERIVDYMRHVAEESDRVELHELGRTTEGRPFLLMAISDESGLRNAASHRERVRRLYDVDRTDESAAREIAREGRAILAFSLGVHSTEVGASQASLEMVYQLATRDDEIARRVRERLLVLLVPSMNPDGLDLVNGWYMQTVGTEAEGTRPIELYHPYAGHDNNRDGFFNNLAETAMWSKVLYHDWLPQMIVDEHQMGSDGPRLFLPPFDDPLSPAVHPLVYAQLAAAGQQTVSDLIGLGHTGLATQTIFTGEWPGSVRSTGFWHNMLGILSEVASARLATPLYFAPGALPAQEDRRVNFVEPWPGGWWRLRDIIDLELDLTWALLRWAGDRKEDLLLNFWRMNRDAVETGRAEAPFAFVIPAAQHDGSSARRLAQLLHDGGVEVHRAGADLRFGDHAVGPGAYVVRADQPFRPFLMEMLAETDYPIVRENGAVKRPYDVTAWRLPDLLGVRVLEVGRAFELESMALERVREFDAPVITPGDGPQVLPARDAASSRAANLLLARGVAVSRVTRADGPALPGDFHVETEASVLRGVLEEAGARCFDAAVDAQSRASVQTPRVLLYSPWGGSMDEGWTRLVLERYGFASTPLRPDSQKLRGENDGRRLRRDFDVVLLPSISTGELESGRNAPGRARMYETLWPSQYRGGLGGAEVGVALRAFCESGGTVIALNHSLPWAVEHMGLPISLPLEGVDADEFYAPGTLVRGAIDISHPLGWGMPEAPALYFNRGHVIRPRAWPRPTEVVAQYADRDVLVAGFLEGASELEGGPALAEIPVGEGRVILFGFSPQRRAQTESTFKLLFNALWRSTLQD